jgi:hypothetical protein
MAHTVSAAGSSYSIERCEKARALRVNSKRLVAFLSFASALTGANKIIFGTDLLTKSIRGLNASWQQVNASVLSKAKI